MNKKNTENSRRQFLQRVGALGATAGMSAFLSGVPRLSLASGPSNGVVVVIFQRGGNDGLNMLVPASDEDTAMLETLRPSISDDAHSLRVALPNIPQFKLHASMNVGPKVNLGDGTEVSEFVKLICDRHISFCPATHVGDGLPGHVGDGLPGTLSHFKGQEIIEYGGSGDSIQIVKNNILGSTSSRNELGWIARALSGDVSRFEAFGFGPSDSLKGNTSIFTATDPSELINLAPELQLQLQSRNLAVESAYFAGVEEKTAAGESLRTQITTLSNSADLGSIDYTATPIGEDYKFLGRLGSNLSQTAALIENVEELCYVTINDGGTPGYDLHSNQAERHPGLLNGLAKNLLAFRKRMESVNKRVEVVVITEFGRTVDENGSRGTDHGQASCPILMNAGMYAQPKNSSIIGDWQDLDTHTKAEHNRHYLMPITDYRDLLSEVVMNTLGDVEIRSVFDDADPYYQRDSKPLHLFS